MSRLHLLAALLLSSCLIAIQAQDEEIVNETLRRIQEEKQLRRQSYLERDYTCKHGCVPFERVTLIWCQQQVQYTFCNRTIIGPHADSVRAMEEGAINAYMAIIRKVGGLGNDACKAALRNWMCWEFFNKCTTDGESYYPVCHSSCFNAKESCDAWFVDCNLELEESYEEYKEFAFLDDRGRYKRGRGGTPIFSKDPSMCTGGADPGTQPQLIHAVLLAFAWISVHVYQS